MTQSPAPPFSSRWLLAPHTADLALTSRPPQAPAGGGRRQVPASRGVRAGKGPRRGRQSLLPQLESQSPRGSGLHNRPGEPPRCSAGAPAPQDSIWTLGPTVPAAAAAPLGGDADSGTRAASDLDTCPPAAPPQRWAGQPAGPEAVGTLCPHQTRARQSPQQGSGCVSGGYAKSPPRGLRSPRERGRKARSPARGIRCSGAGTRRSLLSPPPSRPCQHPQVAQPPPDLPVPIWPGRPHPGPVMSPIIWEPVLPPPRPGPSAGGWGLHDPSLLTSPLSLRKLEPPGISSQLPAAPRLLRA